MRHRERSESVIDAVNGMIADIKQRKETILMQSGKGNPQIPSIGEVHGTAILAENVTINTVNSPVSMPDSDPISPDQVVELDNAVAAIAQSDTSLTKDGIWGELYAAMGMKAIIPAARFDEAKAILTRRSAEVVSAAINQTPGVIVS